MFIENYGNYKTRYYYILQTIENLYLAMKTLICSSYSVIKSDLVHSLQMALHVSLH